jgi:hypothetical protein
VARRSPGGAGYAARAVALLVCLGSVAGIVRLAQQGPATSAPGAAAASSADGGGCATRKRAEIEREKAAGRLTAEQAMVRRQKIARECG